MSVKLPFLKRFTPEGLPDEEGENEEPEVIEHSKQTISESPSLSHDRKDQMESIVILRKASSGMLKIKVNQGEKVAGKAGFNLSELRRLLQEKSASIHSLREAIQDKKLTLKEIGEEVDKNLSKTLVKANKGGLTVNIRDIFSAPSKSDNGNINQFNEELLKIRMQINKIKSDLQKAGHKHDPVLQSNHERGLQYMTRIKEYDAQIRKIEQQKELLSDELSRTGRECNLSQETQKQEQIKHLGQNSNELAMAIKEERLKMYRIEKEDMVLVEKVKFLQQREQVETIRKQKTSVDPQEKVKIDSEMRILIKSINEIIDERNQIQQERKLLLRNLTAQTSQVEAKNWELFNKLREQEAYLLQYYEGKTKKKSITTTVAKDDIKSIRSEGKHQNKHQSKNDRKGTPAKETVYDDKNIEDIVIENVLSQKKRTYEFGSFEKGDSEVILSDQIYGSKNKMIKIALLTDSQSLLGIQATYKTADGIILDGYLIGAKERLSQCKVIELPLMSEEVLTFIQLGVNQVDKVKYVNLLTSQGKELKWGSNTELTKSEQKNIRKYEQSFIKGKIRKSQGVFTLVSFGLTTVYLSVK